MTNGIRTPDLDPATLLDDVLGNRDGSTTRQSMANLSTQIAGSGAVADRFDELEAQITSGQIAVSDWTTLAAITPTQDGTGADVLDSDTGTHAQATATGYDGATVANGGRYSWNATWSRWVRIGNSFVTDTAPADHDHAIADVTGLQAALDGKSATGHSHAIGDVTGLQAALDGKSATSHSHAIADVTGLQGELDVVGGLDGRISAVEVAVSVPVTFGHAAPSVTPGTSGFTGSGNVAIGDPVTVSGVIRTLYVQAHAAGDLEIFTATKSSDTFTKQQTATVTVAVGWNAIAVDMSITAGQHFGFSGSGIVAYRSGDAHSGGWYFGGTGASFTDATVSLTSYIEIGISIDVTGDIRMADVADDVATLQGRSINRQSDNLVDPTLSQTVLGKYIVATSGAVTTLANYGTLGPYPVTAGTAYRLDLSAALDVWQVSVNSSKVVFFYDSDTLSAATLVAASEAGENDVTIDAAKRIVTFTAPAGATHVGFSVQRKSGTVDAADFEELLAAVSLTEGLAAADLMSAAMTDVAHDVVAVRAAPYLYVRCPYRPGQHVVYRVMSGYSPGSNNGVTDFDGIRLVSDVEPYANTAAAWTASAVILTAGGDASPPHRINGHYLGGGHGVLSRQVTKTAHGKTNADVGSTYTDGASKSWVLTEVTDANRFIVTAANTGTATIWAITGDVTGTLTHSAGGTNIASVTPDSVGAAQLWPIAQGYRTSATLDGQPVIADGVYFGRVLRLTEDYGIPNVASLLDALVAGVGSTDDPAYDDPDIQTQVEVQTAYTWDFTGLPEVVHTTIDVQPYTVDYHGGMQHVKMQAGSNDTLHLYVPRCSTGTLATGASEASLSGTIEVDAADWDDPANPPDRVYQVLKRGTEPRHGLMLGYSKTAGVDRTDLDTALSVPSGTMKLYPHAIDTGHGATAVAGTLREVVGFFGAFDPQRDQDFAAKVLFRDTGAHALYLHATAAVAARWVQLPARFTGQPVTTTLSVGFTLHSTVVSARGIRVSSAGAGELEVRVG